MITSNKPAKISEVRIGVIGLGNMGSVHARTLLEGQVPGAILSAVSDLDERRFQGFSVPAFARGGDLIRSGQVDAVVIATPHFSHTSSGISALEAGLHVVVEKPISAQKSDCEKLIAAHRDPRQVFCATFNQRTDPRYRKVRELIRNGELGTIRRINWIITDWFRTNAYYGSGGWRATWAGEGGGVLLNQAPHNLDLWQWLFGMPSRVRAFCKFGKYHPIEVEDDVTAYLEYDDGATGVFITTTGEAPGTNRLEITGDRGRLIVEEGKLLFTRNEIPMDKFNRTTTGGFSRPPVWDVEISVPPAPPGGQHRVILENFVSAIREGTPLIAPAAEGIHSVELANAMLLSSFEDRTLTLPLDASAYEAALNEKIKASKSHAIPIVPAVAPGDFANSFAH
jgi:predicted dehydrogenase